MGLLRAHFHCHIHYKLPTVSADELMNILISPGLSDSLSIPTVSEDELTNLLISPGLSRLILLFFTTNPALLSTKLAMSSSSSTYD